MRPMAAHRWRGSLSLFIKPTRRVFIRRMLLVVTIATREYTVRCAPTRKVVTSFGPSNQAHIPAQETRRTFMPTFLDQAIQSIGSTSTCLKAIPLLAATRNKRHQSWGHSHRFLHYLKETTGFCEQFVTSKSND